MIKLKPDTIVFYLCPDYPTPSWGIGLLYAHVRILNSNGIQAAIVHQHTGFTLEWLDVDVDIRYLDDPQFCWQADDILVVPEVLASSVEVKQCPSRKVVFVQGGFLIDKGLGQARDYQELGFEHSIVILPHMQRIVERHYGIAASVVSPYLPDYFFSQRSLNDCSERAKQIVTVPKSGYESIGYFDYQILKKQLGRMIERKPQWELLELSNYSHQQVADVLQGSAFFVGVNCLEGFNTTIAEAMASGCIPICYDAVGGREYLVDQVNSFVFPNNHLYPMLECIYDCVERFEVNDSELNALRVSGIETAKEYVESRTESELLACFS